MLALIAVLMAVWALACVVLAYERGGPTSGSAPVSALPSPERPSLTVAPGGTVIVAGRVTIVEATPPVPVDPPTTMTFRPSTRVAAAYGVLPPAGGR